MYADRENENLPACEYPGSKDDIMRICEPDDKPAPQLRHMLSWQNRSVKARTYATAGARSLDNIARDAPRSSWNVFQFIGTHGVAT